MVLASFDSGLYKTCLILHILCAIAGFGAVMLNGVYGQQIKIRLQSGRVSEALGIYEANFFVTQIGQYLIYGVFIFGFVTALQGDPFIKFDQTWLWLSMVIYLAAIGLSHGVMTPTVKRMGVLIGEMAAGPPPVGGPPPQAAEMAELGKKIGTIGPILDLSIVVVLFLMVWKPGL
jgi:hypothetical protein